MNALRLRFSGIPPMLATGHFTTEDRMRLAIKAAIMTIVFFGAVNYAAYLQTGRSLFPLWLEKTLARITRLKADAGQALSSVNMPGGSGDVFYKWADADGVQHYTNIPPPAGTASEIVQVNPDANLTRAVVPPQSQTPQTPPAAAPADQATAPAEVEAPFPYSPEQIKKTLDDARNAQQMMNEKLEKQQRILENL
jgi:hypothetical protein